MASRAKLDTAAVWKIEHDKGVHGDNRLSKVWLERVPGTFLITCYDEAEEGPGLLNASNAAWR